MIRVLTWCLCSWLVIAAAGCGGGSSVSSYYPTGGTAKSALTTALEAWKSGREKPGTIDSAKPAVQVQDTVWESGRKLKDFQIGEEQPSPDGPTRFTVNLTFDGDPASEKADYYVVGKDPLWVMRDKDYLRLKGQ